MARRHSGVVVTGIGMRTPVGHHAIQSASAVRAGINRFRTWPHFGLDPGTGSGLAASFMTPDLGDVSWVEKARDLLPSTITEALWTSRLWNLAEYRGKVRAFIATPYPDRAGMTTEAFQELAPTLGEDCFDEAMNIPTELVALDHAAGLIAMARAIEQLTARTADLCVVGAVDSFLESTFLQALLAEGRLKAGQNSSGLIPGEGAAALVLERADDALQRQARPLALVEAIALERDTPYQPHAPIRAEGLTRALRTVLDVTGAREVRRVMSDLNGERWRFLEWALAETRCLDGLPRGWQLWHPADCLGDVGAAFGPTAVALAARAFARGYHGDGKVLIAACSDRGERAAMCLSAPTR